MKKMFIALAVAALFAACCQTDPQPNCADPAETVMANILSRKSVRSYTSDTIPSGDNFNLSMYKQSAAVVVLCADTTVVRPPRENPDAPAVQQPNNIWRDDMGAVTENLLLAVEGYGLGACWTACYPYADRMAPVKQALGLPETVVPYSVVPIGYPAGGEQPKDKWDPSRIHYERW